MQVTPIAYNRCGLLLKYHLLRDLSGFVRWQCIAVEKVLVLLTPCL